jgi:4-hydroxy-tetrahydrodipicolinate synthase
MHELCEAARAGDALRVRELNGRVARLNKALFVEANPIPVKWAMTQLPQLPFYKLGYRLPMADLNESHHETVRRALQEAGLI